MARLAHHLPIAKKRCASEASQIEDYPWYIDGYLSVEIVSDNPKGCI